VGRIYSHGRGIFLDRNLISKYNSNFFKNKFNESSAKEEYYVMVNGNIRTIDDSIPLAQAFAVNNGKFVDIGTNEEILERHPNANVRFLPYSFDLIQKVTLLISFLYLAYRSSRCQCNPWTHRCTCCLLSFLLLFDFNFMDFID